jgi:hypothetical protein
VDDRIRDASHPERAALSVPVYGGGVATSGDYERCMVVDGVRYGHILDPRTGWPIAGLASVTVFAPSCLVAGSATTIALLQGERRARGSTHSASAHAPGTRRRDRVPRQAAKRRAQRGESSEPKASRSRGRRGPERYGSPRRGSSPSAREPVGELARSWAAGSARARRSAGGASGAARS